MAPRPPEEEAKKSLLQAAAVFSIAAVLGVAGGAAVCASVHEEQRIVRVAGVMCVPRTPPKTTPPSPVSDPLEDVGPETK